MYNTYYIQLQKGIIRLFCTIGDCRVHQWLAAFWRAEEPGNHSVQEAGSLRTRSADDAHVSEVFQSVSSPEIHWCESLLKGWRSCSLNSMDNGTSNRHPQEEWHLCVCCLPSSFFTFISCRLPSYWMMSPKVRANLSPTGAV